MTTPPTKLLLSAHALRTWGDQILAAVPAGSLTFVTAEAAISAGGACDADIAFMTREVTGASSKGNPSPQLRDFEILLRGAPKLRWLQIHPAGAERPLYAELRARGVRVTTASGATAITVAHSTLGAVIALNRRFPLLADAQRRHAWEQRLGANAPRDLKGQTRRHRRARTDRTSDCSTRWRCWACARSACGAIRSPFMRVTGRSPTTACTKLCRAPTG